MIDGSFWHGKKVFLTGHTGFKGGWLALWLQSLGAEVQGYALEPPTEPNLFTVGQVAALMSSTIGDIRDLETLRSTMRAFAPDIVFHLAAQPLVRASYDDPVGTYATNVMGTVNVLESVRACPGVRAVVVVTTDKAYENREWAWGYRENEPLGGHDPYSNSKGCTELVSAAYRSSFLAQQGIALATARAGNVIGGGDWAVDRLVPDLLRAFERGVPAVIRNPNAVRPWQHVLEPLSGYLMLAQALWHRGAAVAEGWNFGPRDDDARPVRWIVERLANAWGPGARWELETREQPHEAQMLKLDISKARQGLKWAPRWTLAEALDRIVAWHQAWRQHADVRGACLRDIGDYSRDMNRTE
jgi:CDP-glucose 4,6-dehydratase